MLHRCANSRCSKRFLKLREGKLFLVETGNLTKTADAVRPRRKGLRQVERFWLCDECAARWTLVYDPDRGVALTPLNPSVASTQDAPGATA